MYVRRMRGRFLAVICSAFTLVSCSGAHEPSRDTPVVVVPTSPPIAAQTGSPPENPIPSAIASTSAAPPADSAANPGSPLPYPEAWIMRARGENSGLSCLELVYKNGCSQTRTGIVTFDVTIDDSGAVVKFSEVDNQIRNDKTLVSKCLKNNLLKWKFHPPEGHLNTFLLPVALSDKC
jgi:hypothetical protein